MASPTIQSQPRASVAPSGAGRVKPVPSPCRVRSPIASWRTDSLPRVLQSVGRFAGAVVWVGSGSGVGVGVVVGAGVVTADEVGDGVGAPEPDAQPARETVSSAARTTAGRDGSRRRCAMGRLRISCGAAGTSRWPEPRGSRRYR